MCEYVLCDVKIKEGQKYIEDIYGKEWCVSCYNLHLNKELRSFTGRAIDKHYDKLNTGKKFKIKKIERS